MTTPSTSTLDLRLALADAFAADPPPAGARRARDLIATLQRTPNDIGAQHRARDLLAVVDLRQRLITARDRARQLGTPHVALTAHGLIGHADAELLGSTSNPGWRAAALDLLDPDDEHRDPLDRDEALRLLVLALGSAPLDDAPGS